MIDPTSRYAPLARLSWTNPDGEVIRFVARRFLPAPESLDELGRTPARSDDRPDLIAARTLGDPTAFWRVADANLVLDPGELVDVTGRVLVIPVPQP